MRRAMTSPSGTHLVLIPTYNTGTKIVETVRGARAFWNPVWVVIDGSTDDTGRWLAEEAARDPGLRILVLPENQGKGAAMMRVEALRRDLARFAVDDHAHGITSLSMVPRSIYRSVSSASAGASRKPWR